MIQDGPGKICLNSIRACLMGYRARDSMMVSSKISLQAISVGLCGTLWDSVGLCGILWDSVGSCGILWDSVGFCVSDSVCQILSVRFCVSDGSKSRVPSGGFYESTGGVIDRSVD